jgi:hypothetical protein
MPAPVAPVVPPTLEGLLTERLDRLRDLGDVIHAASVIGREFERDLLAALEPLGGGDIEPGLALLAGRGLLGRWSVRGRGSSSRTRCCRRLPTSGSRRYQLHRQVAETLAQGNVVWVEPEVVAHHWSTAAAPAQAIA